METLRLPSHNRRVVREQLCALGFAALDDAISPDLMCQLRAEARQARAAAVRAEGDAEVLYRAHVTGMGPVARDFLANIRTAQVLADIFQAPLILSENASCYTYYAEGDRLGLHRDRPRVCLATLILYLDVQSTDAHIAASGLILRVFGRHRPRAGARPAAVIPSRSGRVVVGWGTRVWHERPQLQPGESIAALTACFQRGDV